MKFRFFRAGTSVSTMTVTMGSDGNTYSARRATKVLNPSGNQVAQVCTTDTATRFN